MQIKVITRLSGYFFCVSKGGDPEKIQGGLPKSATSRSPKNATSCRKGDPSTSMYKAKAIRIASSDAPVRVGRCYAN